MASAIQDRDRKLRDAVAQKTELIREIHHRVKNNLQIVMSLLSLQAGQVSDPMSRSALAEAQMRIRALALVHRMLHEIEDQTTIELHRLLADLAGQIAEGFGGGRDDVRMEMDVVPASVSADVAIPLALFSVEALTNAYKYAFPETDPNGVVRVVLKREGNEFLLAVQDNGAGYDPATIRPSMGSRLIANFGQQVGGTSSVKSAPGKGTSVEVRFPNPDDAARAADIAAQ
jgi:two-component sensor histidine kinase